MAELATIARPYAEALFQVSRADLAATQSWLDSLARAAGNDELLQFAANPKVNASQVFHIVTSVLQGPPGTNEDGPHRLMRQARAPR